MGSYMNKAEYIASIWGSAADNLPNHDAMVMLRRTIGNAMWIDGLTDAEAMELAEYIMPVYDRTRFSKRGP